MTTRNSTSANQVEKTKAKKNTRPKFPLFLHASGQWSKKVRGKLLYFGKDQDAALERWIREKEYLLAGRIPPAFDPDAMTLIDLCNRFVAFKEQEKETGEITERQYLELKRVCEIVLDEFGKKTVVESLCPENFAKLKFRFSKGLNGKKLKLTSQENSIARTRTLFNWAAENGLIQKNMAMFWGTSFKKPSKKAKARAAAQDPIVRMFTPDEVKTLMEHASPQIKAMILLAVNCGLGNTDIGQLERHHIKGRWLCKARSKTGKDRKVRLWKETIEAIEACSDVRPTPRDPADADRIFVTKYGWNWIPTVNANPISQEFTKLKKATGIEGKGKSFYSFRHVFQTIGDETLDFVAVKFMMGHDGSNISNEYREGISDERLQRVTDHIHTWLFGGAS